jgi:hypothetical protein
MLHRKKRIAVCSENLTKHMHSMSRTYNFLVFNLEVHRATTGHYRVKWGTICSPWLKSWYKYLCSEKWYLVEIKTDKYLDKRTALFWVIMQQVVETTYRHFRITHRSHLWGSRIQPRRAQVLPTLWRKPEIWQPSSWPPEYCSGHMTTDLRFSVC